MSHQLTSPIVNSALRAVRPEKRFSFPAWSRFCHEEYDRAVIEPFYPKAGNGRRPHPLETMLRIHCMQHWYNLSDGAMEDALYEIASMRLFARLFSISALPDRTTIMVSATCSSSINWPVNCSRPSIAGWPKQAS